jgi:uncharacterized protein
MNLASAIYTGQVRHRRFEPKAHAFNYSVFMMYLDTRELEEIFSLSPLWSLKRWAPVRFAREDFHTGNSTDDKPMSVDEAVRNTVLERTGIVLTGPIRMLVNLRYWGFNMNPLSTYYCFDASGTEVLAIVAEVHNTPWNERHSYVLAGDDFSNKQKAGFKKQFHVSPFNPIAMDYRWFSTTPAQTLAIHLENWQQDKKIMDATLTLEREPITATALNKILIRFPWMTVKVITAIYWQALKLWAKGLPLFDHSASQQTLSLGEEKRL